MLRLTSSNQIKAKCTKNSNTFGDERREMENHSQCCRDKRMDRSWQGEVELSPMRDNTSLPVPTTSALIIAEWNSLFTHLAAFAQYTLLSQPLLFLDNKHRVSRDLLSCCNHFPEPFLPNELASHAALISQYHNHNPR